MKHTRKPRIGIIGMGHFIYWPQFEGLKETLMQKQQSFKAYFSGESDLVDLGFADDIDTSFEALKRPARLRQNHHLYAAVQRRYLLTSRIFRRV